MTNPAPPWTLTARDPRTFRSYSIGLTRAVEVDNPALFAGLIAATAETIAREWVRRYAVPFPTKRIVWRVAQLDTFDRRARNLDASAVLD